MAVNPSKLKSYLEQSEEDAAIPDYEDESDMDMSEYEEEAAEEMEEAGATGDYEGFLKLLFQHAPEIQSAASTVYVTALDAIDDDVRESITSSLAEMPQELVDGIKAHLAEMDADELHELVEQLEEAGVIENDASVVPFLYWAARAA